MPYSQANKVPLLCPELIGREKELGTLKEALFRAAAGQPQFVWLTGEAGVGKTKLCRTFMEMSREQHVVVLYGQTIPQDQSLPFSLFLDLFRRYSDASLWPLTPFDYALHSTFSFLWQFLPDLASLFPKITPPTFDNASTPPQQQQMLFHMILRGLQTLAQMCKGPLVLILEDLHWADETSLELLAFLVQRLNMHAHYGEPSTALLIIGTQCNEALPDTSILPRILSQLHSQRAIQIIQLAPLDCFEHRRNVRSILNQPVSEAFTDFLFEWDEGNPFFTEELLGAMMASGQLQALLEEWRFPPGKKPTLPSSLTTVIQQRFLQLSPADRDVLTHAAVIGRQFDFSLLATLSGVYEHDLVQVLQHAIRAQIIKKVSYIQHGSAAKDIQEHYQFRYALIRETIYESMLHPERRLRHRTIAQMVERLVMEQRSNISSPTAFPANAARLIVEHYYLAGLAAQAYPYALQEAKRANNACEFHEERHYLNMAQASLPAGSPEHLKLFERLGMVNLNIYDFLAALHWFSLAKEGYEQSGQSSQALQVLAYMLFPAWFLASSTMPQMLTEVEEALETAFTHPDDTKRDTNVLVAASILSMYQINQCRYHRIAQWVERTINLFHSLADPRKEEAIQLSYIAFCWAKAHSHLVSIEACIAELQEILAFARRHNLLIVLMTGYITIIMMLIFWGRMDEAKQSAEEAIEDENRYGTPRVNWIIGWQYFYSGTQWEQGVQFLRHRIADMKQENIPCLLAIESMILAHLLIARHELNEASEYLHEAQPIIDRKNESLYIIWMRWGFAKLYVAQGDLTLAQKWYERTLEYWKTTEDMLFILTILLDGVAYYVQIGNLTRAEAWQADLHILTTMTGNPIGSAALLEAQGMIATKKEQVQLAIVTLRQALEAWDKLQFRYHYALTAQQLAEVLLQYAEQKTMKRKERQDARKEAEDLLTCAFIVYDHLSVLTSKDAVQALRVRTHLDAQQKRCQTLETTHQWGGLTQRERQILSLLANAQSNREIAETLSISVGTVALHVTNILTKLQCKTRAQASILAITQGWIKVTPKKSK